ncbi:hypothetical protein PGB90_002976 [Kerria lacca]
MRVLFVEKDCLNIFNVARFITYELKQVVILINIVSWVLVGSYIICIKADEDNSIFAK